MNKNWIFMVLALGLAVSARADFPLTRAPHDQCYPGLAYGKAQYLAAWYDYREGQAFPRIYAARITPQGQILDPEGIPMPKAVEGEYYSTVAYSGDNYLVVWQRGC